uniref:RNA guanine-7 methyltransferase activating subunit n=1 Tax=Kryptolebias marmoratus TaxID=37003 RepID=A0A3Q3FKZ5_KRYMA
MAETSENPKSYEDLFAHRFSSEDEEYQQYLSRPADPPPVKAQSQDRRGPRGRGWGGERSWRGDHRGQQPWPDRDRHWGHGSGYQSGPPGYNSHHQRPHYDRY